MYRNNACKGVGECLAIALEKICVDPKAIISLPLTLQTVEQCYWPTLLEQAAKGWQAIGENIMGFIAGGDGWRKTLT